MSTYDALDEWAHNLPDDALLSLTTPGEAFAQVPGVLVYVQAVLWEWKNETIHLAEDTSTTRLVLHTPAEDEWRVFNFSRGWEGADADGRRRNLLFEYDDNSPLPGPASDLVTYYAASFEEGLSVPVMDPWDSAWAGPGPDRFNAMTGRLQLTVSAVCELVHRSADPEAIRTVLALSFPTTLSLVDDYPFGTLRAYTTFPGQAVLS